MFWLGIDVETTGVDNGDHVIEIGACLVNVEEKQIVQTYGVLIDPGPEHRDLHPDIIRLTRIRPSNFTCLSSLQKNLDPLLYMMYQADYLVAHNAEYERKTVPTILEPQWVEYFNKKPWIDTYTDLPVEQDRRNKLAVLSYNKRVFNPMPHRAMSDAITMMQILCTYNADDVLKWATSPKVTILSLAPFEMKDKVKELGYGWNGANKQWTKEVPDFLVEQEVLKATEAGFKVQVVQPQATQQSLI